MSRKCAQSSGVPSDPITNWRRLDGGTRPFDTHTIDPLVHEIFHGHSGTGADVENRNWVPLFYEHHYIIAERDGLRMSRSFKERWAKVARDAKVVSCPTF